MPKARRTRLDVIVEQVRRRSEGQVFARLADLRAQLKEEKANEIEPLCAAERTSGMDDSAHHA